ncbi:VOC family protein [Xanthomonas euvesicatoria]|uniref:VOC family protein n=1 Tax=Xanthomonas euvesicatoria TaxID=456327 RepID=UPI003D2F992C
MAKDAGTQAFSNADQLRSYERHWTPVHLDFVVDDLEQAVAQSLAAGATQEQAIRDNSWGRIAVMADPFGHGYCLIEFTAAGYDAVASSVQHFDGRPPAPRRGTSLGRPQCVS